MLVRRETKTGADDLITLYRPCRIDEIVGNATNKKVLKNSLDKHKVSHTMLFTGDAGCGKTTAARIIALGLNCEQVEEGKTRPSEPCLACSSCTSIMNHSNPDVQEINVGKSGTKGDVSHLVGNLASAPFCSNVKVLIFDEAHKLTPASIDLLLKVLEDGYRHVYFIFCTDQPALIKQKAFHSRVKQSKLHFGKIADSLIYGVLENVCQFEGMSYNEQVLRYIVEKAEGVPRDALGFLKLIEDEGTWDLKPAKELISGTIIDEENEQIINLSRALVKQEWTNSLEVFDKLKKAKGFSIEAVRLAVSGYFVGCLKKEKNLSKAMKFSRALDVLNVPIYDQGKTAENRFYNYMIKVIEAMVVGGKK